MKISLITATFNSGMTVRDTIESVLKQTYSDIEYILVDGKSSDNTMDIIKEYEPAFEGRMKWISEPDCGLYDAMNKGIRMSSGDIVGIINSDDFYLENNILSIINETFEDQSIQAVFGDVRFVYPSNLDKTIRYYSSKRFTPKQFRFGFMPAHPTFFTYKKYFDEFGYYNTNYKIASDYELLIRFLYKKNLKYKYLPIAFMKMRMGGKSTSGLKSNITLNKEIVTACKENDLYTNSLILSLKYFVKIWEFILPKQ
ncbi:MAG: glycosyltransferase family 2 protein [Dysgonomonas sp.]